MYYQEEDHKRKEKKKKKDKDRDREEGGTPAPIKMVIKGGHTTTPKSSPPPSQHGLKLKIKLGGTPAVE